MPKRYVKGYVPRGTYPFVLVLTSVNVPRGTLTLVFKGLLLNKMILEPILKGGILVGYRRRLFIQMG